MNGERRVVETAPASETYAGPVACQVPSSASERPFGIDLVHFGVIVVHGGAFAAVDRSVLVRAIASAHRWQRMTLLSPGIVEAIRDGRQPEDVLCRR